jgi:Cytidine and deoxycytidylate deaminase zinc-binding region
LNGRVTADDRHLLAAIGLAQRARDNGNHPFGAFLVDADDNVAVESENTVVTGRDCTGHAETNVMREASQRFDPGFRRVHLVYLRLQSRREPLAHLIGSEGPSRSISARPIASTTAIASSTFGVVATRSAAHACACRVQAFSASGRSASAASRSNRVPLARP